LLHTVYTHLLKLEVHLIFQYDFHWNDKKQPDFLDKREN
jgi:hypothetical protein